MSNIITEQEQKSNDAFDELKNRIKAGDVNKYMFSINKLTHDIVEIIIRLYHVNIKNIIDNQNLTERPKYMCGILQDICNCSRRS